jgi:hypothetical protein
MNDQPVNDCSLEKSDRFTGDSTSHTMRWGGNAAAGNAGEWRKVHLHVRDAEVFSFRLRDASDET